MPQFLSPEVRAVEIDLTTIIPAVSTTTAAVVGPFRWGPVNERTLIDSELTLRDVFGTPDNNCAVSWFTAKDFLAYANSLYIVRVISTTNTLTPAKNATADGTGVLIRNRDEYLANYENGQGAKGMWAAKYPGDMGNSLKVSLADINSYPTWDYANYFDGSPNTSSMVAAYSGSNDEIHVVVVDSDGGLTGVAGTVLERYPFLSKSALAQTEDGSSQYYAEIINRKSRYIWWMDHPANTNWGGDLSVDYDTLELDITLGTPSGTFTVGEKVQCKTTVTITSPGSGATATATVDTGAVTAITVGNGGTLYSGAPIVTISGNGSGATATATVVNGIVTAIAVGSGGSGYTAATVSITPAGSGATGTATVNDDGVITAITVTAGGSLYNGAPSVIIAGPGTGATATATIVNHAVTAIIVGNGGSRYTTIEGTVLTWSTPVLSVRPTKGTFVSTQTLVGFTSAAHGTFSSATGGPLTYQLSGGVDDNAHVDTQEKVAGWENFRSVEEVDISLLLGSDANSTIAMKMIELAEFRADCVAILSPPKAAVVNNVGYEATDIIEFRNYLPSTSYAVMDSGWKETYDVYNDVYRWVPLNGDVAGLCARTDDQRDAWWSPAGYNRGIMKNVNRLAWNPRKAFRDQLYQNGINPVITERGQGTLLFGDKTLLSKPSAFDRINVRRLFIVLRKAISRAAKYTLFEFNDDFTRAQFVAMVEPYLRDVQGRRGIYDFKVVCDSTNNTPEVIDRNEFHGDIYIKPARVINFILLNFVAVRTGVDFSEVVGKF